jgi:hypothetical protein
MDNSYTSKVSECRLPSICYSVGCDNPATTSIKIPLNAILCCVIWVCNDCISKYQAANGQADDIHKHHHPDLQDSGM